MAPGLVLSPSTTDPAVARGWLISHGSSGIEGVVAKPSSIPSRPPAGRQTSTPARLRNASTAGATLVRPALEKLRDLVAQVPVDVVLVYSPDRLPHLVHHRVVARLGREWATAAPRCGENVAATARDTAVRVATPVADSQRNCRSPTLERRSALSTFCPTRAAARRRSSQGRHRVPSASR